MQVDVREARIHLSRLLERVEAGEEIVLARAGRPVARLCPVARHAERRRALGRDAGVFTVPDDFDDPLPADVLASFSG